MLNKKLFLLLVSGFTLATIIGLLLIISSLYVTAKNIGCNPRMYYNGVYWGPADTGYHSCDTAAKYITEIRAKKHFPGEDKLSKFSKDLTRDYALIMLTPLLVTMSIGTIAFILLFLYKNSIKRLNELKPSYWILIYLALFWLLEPFIMVIWLAHWILNINLFYYNFWNNIADFLRVPDWLLAIPTGLIGLVILATIVFRFVPSSQRFTLILSGIIGAGIGIGMWFFVIGPKLIP